MAKSRKTKAKYKDFQKVKLKVTSSYHWTRRELTPGKFLSQFLNPANTLKPLEFTRLDGW